ncbi:Retrovirus-related Pol polyprotein from transposon RE1 [Vitis vinifera]|uniref:Retrovirus-related Pol polyprotein from transposon RE1 n=1 Tax=Vitis vinifera TaxID=29760 RepID=A0A438FI19_VITVI|nr:Retrovirus-related Pol polyprotein from transposon RE1 [Vitis vinifera]
MVPKLWLKDRSTGKTIGIGRESQGLYHLTSPSTPAVCISTDAPLLIHSRLGHPSLSKFQKMVPRFSSLSSLACESCQLGKHTRVSFPKRLNNRAKSPFELVHTDVWGPCRTATNFLPKPQNASSWDIPDFKRVIVVIPLRLIATFSPLIAFSPTSGLSSPHRVAVPPSLAEVPADSLPIPSASPAPALPPSADLPIALRKVGCRWVYTVKVGPDGQVDRLKARLVAKGYTQVYGSDYGDTFSPVAKIASVRLLLSMAAMRSWPLYQLRRSLYGLKQSPRAWFSRFSSVVQEFGMFAVQQTIPFSIIITLRGSTKDLGKLKYFLGIEIAQSSSGVVLSQRKYALDILEETGMLDCKPVDTPMDPNVKLIPGQGEPLGDPGRYRRLVAIGIVIRILRYIKSTPGQGVLYENRGHTQSKKQDVVARSSAEAEYRAMALATCELIWLKHLLRELRFGKDEQMKLICDNQAALHIASNPVFHERTKHIEVDCHFIREKIASGCVATSFVNSNDQLADIFTKSLRGPRIKYICNKLGAYNIYAPA